MLFYVVFHSSSSSYNVNVCCQMSVDQHLGLSPSNVGIFGFGKEN